VGRIGCGNKRVSSSNPEQGRVTSQAIPDLVDKFHRAKGKSFTPLSYNTEYSDKPSLKNNNILLSESSDGLEGKKRKKRRTTH
jgi:hypothetical protein